MRVNSFSVAPALRGGAIRAFGFACLALSVAFIASCGDDDDDDGMMPIAGGGGMLPGGSGGMPAGSGGMSGTGMGGSSGSSAGTGGSSGSGGTMAMNCETAGCPDGQFCVEKQCRDKCTEDAQCDSGEACCKGACFDTDAEHDHCGACDKACEDTERCDDGACVALKCELDFDASVPLDDNGCPNNERCIESSGDGVCMCGDNPSCPTNETCNASGECRCGTNAGCDAGEGCCGSDCVDLDNDEDNCGECGNECATGATCNNGTCECDEAGFAACNGRCIDVVTDERNCGECGKQCAAGTTCRDPAGDRETGCYCPNVNDVACDGVCVTLGTVDNCSQCGDACDGPANECNNRVCECPNPSQTECGSNCVDLNVGRDTDSSGNTRFADCGRCGVTCPANIACVQGHCDCPGAPTTDLYCDENRNTGVKDGVFACIVVNTTQNCGECGNACLDDSVCRTRTPTDSPDDFSCVCVNSDAGKTHCAGIGCRDLDEDPENCGECGHRCPEGIACNDGECDCPGSGTDSCIVDGEPTCVTLTTDENHCGSCGHQCPSDISCTSSRCQCPGGSTNDACLVNGQPQCVNLGTDEENCGSCGKECPSGVSCTNSRCQCPGGNNGDACEVNGVPTCVNIATDENNCGKCGNVCPSGSECCNRVCIDTDSYQTDDANCGECGNNCANDFCFLRTCDCVEGNCE